MVLIFLLLTGLIQMLIYQTLIIQRSHTNISVHTLSLQMMEIMLLNPIIDAFGIYLPLRLRTIFLIGKSKHRNGMQKTQGIGKLKILIIFFMRQRRRKMINNGICTSCDHRHRGKNECSFCDCVWVTEIITIDHNLIETIKGWFKKLIFWR